MRNIENERLHLETRFNKNAANKEKNGLNILKKFRSHCENLKIKIDIFNDRKTYGLIN